MMSLGGLSSLGRIFTNLCSVTLHHSLEVLNRGLQLPYAAESTLRQELASTFVGLSQATRDFTIEITMSRYYPEDIRKLRNLMQGVVRGILAIRSDSDLLEPLSESSSERQNSFVIEVGNKRNKHTQFTSTKAAIQLLRRKLADPTRNLLSTMRSGLKGCDAILMDFSGYRKYLGPPSSTTSDMERLLAELREATAAFDEADSALINDPLLRVADADHPDVVQLFLFIHPVRQVANRVEEVLIHTQEMQPRCKLRVRLPSYPWNKAWVRTNAQVRHDRGGLTAGFYFNLKARLDRAMAEIQNISHTPLPRNESSHPNLVGDPDGSNPSKIEDHRTPTGDVRLEDEQPTLRYKLWKVLHSLQGFESKFAFKVTFVTALASIPAWLPQSVAWWNENESWWAVVMIWMMMHPRVIFKSLPSFSPKITRKKRLTLLR